MSRSFQEDGLWFRIKRNPNWKVHKLDSLSEREPPLSSRNVQVYPKWLVIGNMVKGIPCLAELWNKVMMLIPRSVHDSPRSPPVVLSLQTYQGSDIDIFTFGNPLNTAALFIILLHLVIESKSLVSGFSASEVAWNSVWGKSLLLSVALLSPSCLEDKW